MVHSDESELIALDCRCFTTGENGEELTIVAHCLSSEGESARYTQLRSKGINGGDALAIERVSEASIAQFATRMVTDEANELIVAYDHTAEFNIGADEAADYYVPRSADDQGDTILTCVDLSESPRVAKPITFTTADLPTLRRIEQVQICRDTKLVYVLAESIRSRNQRAHHVYILNAALAAELHGRDPSQRGGLIFVLDIDSEGNAPQVPPLNLFVPSTLQGKIQLPVRVGSLGTEVEQFCLKKNLMPSGFLVTLTELAV